MSYTKRKDGRYQANINLGDGKRKTITAKTVKELKEKELAMKVSIQKGIDVTSYDDTVAMWAERTLSAKQIDMSPKEYTDLSKRCSYMVRPIHSMPLNKVTQAHIQPIINALALENPSTHKPSAKKTLRYYLLALSAVFDFAIENRATEFNPCKYVKLPKTAPETKRRALTKEEQSWILNNHSKYKYVGMILMLAGLRRSELTVLTWSDINLAEGSITVNKAYNDFEHTIKSPKTEAGIRTVTIPQQLVDYLKTLQPDNMLVLHSNGRLLTDRMWRTLWDHFLDDLTEEFGKPDLNGVKHIDRFTPHMLRHTFATLMYEANIPVLICKEQMGHEDIQTTLNIYTHLDATHKRRALSDFDKLIAEI